MTTLEKDTDARNRIVSDTGSNLFVEAGAGSGKTTMLVNRMVAMVEAGIDINKISAITFTKAAAGEFYSRFQKILIERSNPAYVWKDEKKAGQLPAPTETTRKLCAQALENIDLCFMGTIDSFCGMLLSEHPTEAGIPSDSTIISSDEAAALFKREYIKICNREAGDELYKAAGLFRSCVFNDEEVFAKNIVFFMDNRNVRFNYTAENYTDAETFFSKEKSELLAAMDYIFKNRQVLSTGDATSRNAAANFEKSYRIIRKNWDRDLSSIIYALKNISGLRVVNEALKESLALNNVCEPGGKKGAWQDFVPSKKEGLLGKIQELQYSLCMDFFVKCIPYLETVMRDKGYMTYFDALFYLRNMLRDDAKKGGALTKYIYDRHSYFLIDEFQDTNPMQAEVFFFLTAKEAKEKWSEAIPREGSLFIVGDPKQSIYRFRGADVTSFLKVKALFEKNAGDVLYLTRNFRSTKALCEYFNDTFSNLMPEETSNQSKFESIPLPDDNRGEFTGVFSYKAYPGDKAPDSDCKMITKMIKKLIDHDEFKITDEKTGELRKLKAGDIMVITGGKNTLAPIMRQLNAENISTHVEGKVDFEKNNALVDIYYIYRAAALNNNPKAILEALLCRAYGFDIYDVLDLKDNGGNVSFYNTLPDAEKVENKRVLKVVEAIEEIKTHHYASLKLSPAAFFEYLMEKYEMYKLETVDEPEVLYYTLELLRNKEKTGEVVSTGDAVYYLQSLLGGKSLEERCLSLSADKDSVHLANLHKVKGLEAPVVILAAQPAKIIRTTDASVRIEHSEEKPEAYLFSACEKTKTVPRIYFFTNSFDAKQEEEINSLKAEKARHLYVAATRARNVLIVCHNLSERATTSKWEELFPKEDKDFFEIYGNLSPCSEESKTMLVDGLYEKAEEECVLKDRSGEEKSYSVLNPSRVHVSSKLSTGEDENEIISESGEEENETAAKTAENENKPSILHKYPTLLGTMTHRIMEILVSTKNTVDEETVVNSDVHDYITPDKSFLKKEFKEALLTVVKTVRNGGYDQKNDAPKDILKVLVNAEEVYCETPFCIKEDTDEGQNVWNGIMDVVYKENDAWHIIDYKTNAENEELDTKYSGQLEAYIKAFKEATGFDADAKIYHIDI